VGQALVLLAARPLFKCGSYSKFAVSNAKPALSQLCPLQQRINGLVRYELIARLLHNLDARVISY
jgi:hypothetical protein